MRREQLPVSANVQLSTQPGGFVLETSVELPLPPDEIFPFFAAAQNLSYLTPEFLRFEILTPPPIEMAAGTRIDYRIRLRGLPMRWRTEIAAWEPPYRFVDQQLKGPYRRWWHEHRFVPTAAGTRCEDRVEYSVLGGKLVHRLFVRRDLERIFTFRHERMLERFGGGPGA